jgi:glycosyltransferase involved in cell wall biosynthesis
MKLSLITVCYNSEKTIEETILSVLSQDLDNFEYIIIDGNSTDNTLSIIEKYSSNIDLIISEKDHGIYDAINKGIQKSSGDIIGILNSDDTFYSRMVLSSIQNKFLLNPQLDSVIGDIKFANKKGQLHRHYSSLNWEPKKLEWGIMPPHPTFYCKRELFDKFGYYRNDFKIAADYELLIRFFYVNQITFEYIPITFVQMKLGGVSTKNIFSKFNINKEVLYACRLNNLPTNIFKIYTKYFFKILEFIN